MRALMLLAVLLAGCAQQGGPALAYSIRHCSLNDTVSSAFSMNSSDGTIRIHQLQSYVCCANVTVRMEAEGKAIRLYEENVGEMCRCICPFEADIEIANASGIERVEVYGIKFRDSQGYGLLFNSTIGG